MKKRIENLIVDSGAFIKNAPVHEYAENVYSVDGVVKEIKDKATLQRLQVLPYELKLKTPSPESFKYVMEFSKKTGDYSCLSATDLHVIALTYELEKEIVGTTEHLKTEPKCQVTSKPPVLASKPMEGFYYPPRQKNQECVNDEGFSEKSSTSEDFPAHGDDADSNSNLENCSNEPDREGGKKNLEQDDESENLFQNSSNELEEESRTSQQENGSEILSLNEEHEQSEDGDSEDDDGDGSWITPDNVSEIQKRMGNMFLDSDSHIKVACITTDFAVQNVLLQMGLHVISIDGYLIKNIKVFILRCFSCFKTTTDSTKQFCSNCGNKTLKRVSVSVDDDGSKNIHINFKRPINKRGMKYSIPMPKGGRHAVNPHLVEDQNFPQNRPSKAALKKMDVFNPDYIASTSPFAIHDIYSRAAGLGIYGLKQRSQQRKNPNEWSKRTGNRKHKK